MKENLVNLTTTENGDSAYFSSKDIFLDLFALVGSSRNNPKIIKPLFNKALRTDLIKALAVMFYARDIKNGLGERKIFRTMLKQVAEFDSKVASKLIPIIPNYGRYDDLFSLLCTSSEKDLVSFVKKTLSYDYRHRSSKISLLSKWMPSINCHDEVRRRQAKRLAELLNMSYSKYRHILSTLRDGRIIENDLRKMDYSFDYQKVPSLAMNKYRQAFLRNDGERYSEYINDVKNGKSTIHTDTLYPYDIIRTYDKDMSEIEKQAMEEKWVRMKTSLPDLKNTIVVRDGSGSMLSFGGYPDRVATSLAILFSEYLEGELANSFITFSSTPQVVNLNNCLSLYDKLKRVYNYNDYTNTNILKVYQLLAKMEKRMHKSEQIKRVIIISDMEFDQGVEQVPSYETFCDIFKKKNLEIPQIIYLNVCSRHIHFSATKDKQVLLLSGASKNLLSLLTKSANSSPVEFMNEALEPYRKTMISVLGGER